MYRVSGVLVGFGATWACEPRSLSLQNGAMSPGVFPVGSPLLRIEISVAVGEIRGGMILMVRH